MGQFIKICISWAARNPRKQVELFFRSSKPAAFYQQEDRVGSSCNLLAHFSSFHLVWKVSSVKGSQMLYIAEHVPSNTHCRKSALYDVTKRPHPEPAVGSASLPMQLEMSSSKKQNHYLMGGCKQRVESVLFNKKEKKKRGFSNILVNWWCKAAAMTPRIKTPLYMFICSENTSTKLYVAKQDNSFGTYRDNKMRQHLFWIDIKNLTVTSGP